MSDKSKLKEKQSSKRGLFSGVLSLLVKQITASLLFLALVLGMQYSGSKKLNNYAKSLGLAIKFNPNWEETVENAFSDFRSNEGNFR